MPLHIEIKNDELISALCAEALRAHIPATDMAERLLEQQLWSSIPQRPEASLSFARIREKILQQNGGKLFSDSTDIIRESRLNDH